MLLEGVNIEKLLLNDLHQLVINLTKLLEQVMFSNSKGGYSYSYKNVRKNNFQQIILFGGFLVFRIRQFLLKETIFYSLGAQDEFGELFQREFSQDELWSQIVGKNNLAMRASLSSNALKISASLENFKKNQDEFKSVGIIGQWKRILSLGTVASKEDAKKPGGSKIFYPKKTPDNNVFLRFQGNKVAHYYNKGGDTYFFYNKGWLYEWYLTYINKSEENAQILQSSLDQGIIAPIIYGMDSTEGIQSGDFIDLQNRQIQAKFHNQQIITFKNILEALQKINTTLEQLVKTPEEVQEAAQSFAALFTTQESASRLNKNYNTIIEKQLQHLEKFGQSQQNLTVL